MNLSIFQETKLTNGVYTWGSARYIVVAMDALSMHHVRVAVFYWPSPCFTVEAVQQFRPNVLGFQLDMGNCQWYIVGCYLVPNNTSTIESVVFVLKKQPHGSELLVAGDFNVKLSDLEWGWRGGGGVLRWR